MRNRANIFLDKVQEFLKASFAERAALCGIPNIKQWQTGYAVPLSAESEYPACLLYVAKRVGVDAYTADFVCDLGIAIAGDEPAEMERQGLLWQDILEDTFRDDYHLGGACLDIEDGWSIDNSFANGLYVVACSFTAEIDLGGYVYEDEEPVTTETCSENLQEMRLCDTGHNGNDLSEMSQGSFPSDGERENEKTSI